MLPWSHSPILFIKPRHGSRAIGAKSIERLGHRLYRINGHHIVRADALADQLTQLAKRKTLLVQTFLRPAAETLDLSPGAPIELRLTTARRPGEASTVIACLMKVQQPGRHASTTLSGALAAPADPASGVIHSGTFLNCPYRKYATVPWNGASLEGRSIPGYDQAVSMVIKASEALPGLPVIGWDVLLTDAGPMVLEANTSISWWLIHLWHALTNTPSPLLPIIMEWIETRALEE